MLHVHNITPTLPVTPAQLMRPGIGRNASCATDDWLTSRPMGCSQPRESWFFDILMYIQIISLHPSSHDTCIMYTAHAVFNIRSAYVYSR